MNSSWFTHEQFMVMNFRKAGGPSQTILYRRPGDDTWTRGHVLSRGGKASTASWHFMNIKDLDIHSKLCIHERYGMDA